MNKEQAQTSIKNLHSTASALESSAVINLFEIDVSEIAKEFGGGGHKKASGFQLSGELCVDDIFDIDEEEEEIEDEESIDIEEKIQEESKNTKQENNLKELKENLKVLVKKVEEVELSTSQEIITGSI